jgi:hypothetical protein
MEKLSSILPASPRVKSVDLTDAKPRRPGAPAFGAPMGSTSSIRDRVKISGQNPQDLLQETLTYRNPKEFKSARIAEQVTKNFFDNRLKPDESTVAKSEEISENLDVSLEPVAPEELPEFTPVVDSSKQSLEQ